MKDKFTKRWMDLSIRKKLLLAFALTSILMFLINLFTYWQVNQTIQKIDKIYVSNVSLNELSDAFTNIHDDMYSYLVVKSSDALEDYYRSEQIFSNLLSQLNDTTVDNTILMYEKNIRDMSESYLDITQEAVLAKRGRNVEKYKASYEEASDLYKYINSYIYSLNNQQFKNNSNIYQTLLSSLSYLEVLSSIILLIVTAINIMILLVITRNITSPLISLSVAANELGAGNFDVALPVYAAHDEVGVMTHAFGHMAHSIKDYIKKTTESLEKEQQMMEQEFLMESHLKDAQLKYLQAQINPHFLFNSLNAGAQLAMMEDAEKTCLFIERMAEFFRYSVKKISEDSILAEEIEVVDNYIYILNVRFTGDIHFFKNIDPLATHIKIPSMILQPLVENAVNHGIRDIDWEGFITLTVRRQEDFVHISLHDNGRGMTQTRIQEVLSNTHSTSASDDVSTQVGLDNVISRLKLYYNQTDVLSIKSDGPGKGTTITLVLPIL
ncbi:MAG: sensor histidine kinase [Lachnospiraceae bacterium]